jgi:hypothetical protein
MRTTIFQNIINKPKFNETSSLYCSKKSISLSVVALHLHNVLYSVLNPMTVLWPYIILLYSHYIVIDMVKRGIIDNNILLLLL